MNNGLKIVAAGAVSLLLAGSIGAGFSPAKAETKSSPASASSVSRGTDLNRLVTDMQRATGDRKAKAMESVILALVSERQIHGGGGCGCAAPKPSATREMESTHQAPGSSSSETHQGHNH